MELSLHLQYAYEAIICNLLKACNEYHQINQIDF